jgi:hypothetical protein
LVRAGLGAMKSPVRQINILAANKNIAINHARQSFHYGLRSISLKLRRINDRIGPKRLDFIDVIGDRKVVAMDMQYISQILRFGLSTMKYCDIMPELKCPFDYRTPNKLRSANNK